MTTEPGTLARDPRAVFVVHGRHSSARDAMFAFLAALGLQPLEWSYLVRLTGKGSPYVGEVLDAGFKVATAAVVLLTPDDEARLRAQFRSINEPNYETTLTGQARPNVIFEAGMALGIAPDKTVLVEFGTLRPISDLTGRHVIRINNTEQRRRELAERLETAGCPVNLTGAEWTAAGDFDNAIREVQNTGAADSPIELAPGYVIEPLTYHERIGRRTFNIEYPQIQGLPDPHVQRRINLMFEQEFKRFAGLIDDQGQSRRYEYEGRDDDAISTEVCFATGLTTASTISLYASQELNFGGGHPTNFGLGFVVDVGSGYRHSLHSIFRPDQDYITAMRTHIRRSLERQFRDDPYWHGDPPEPDEGTPRPYDFYFTERELDVFNLFGARALHGVSAEIPFSDLEYLADPAGPLARLLASRAAGTAGEAPAECATQLAVAAERAQQVFARHPTSLRAPAEPGR